MLFLSPIFSFINSILSASLIAVIVSSLSTLLANALLTNPLHFKSGLILLISPIKADTFLRVYTSTERGCNGNNNKSAIDNTAR